MIDNKGNIVKINCLRNNIHINVLLSVTHSPCDKLYVPYSITIHQGNQRRSTTITECNKLRLLLTEKSMH